MGAMPDPDLGRQARGIRRGMAAVWILIGLCSAIELVLTLSDHSLGLPPRLRQLAYDYGGFWIWLLYGARGNYAGQEWGMFVSYGFLHGGPMHLIVNMVTLWSLGRATVARVGLAGFLLLYVAALLGGAGGYGLLATVSAVPMVGASGALFGLAGGVLAWDYVDRFALRERLWPVVQVVVLLVTMNAAMWWGLDGQLAWQTHLGGFVTGWIVALLIDPRGRG